MRNKNIDRLFVLSDITMNSITTAFETSKKLEKKASECGCRKLAHAARQLNDALMDLYDAPVINTDDALEGVLRENHAGALKEFREHLRQLTMEGMSLEDAYKAETDCLSRKNRTAPLSMKSVWYIDKLIESKKSVAAEAEE